MRPYLALIKDSFRAAVASNVLYVLLGVITLLLLVVAPLHVRESLDWRLFFRNNVTKIDELSKRLVERGPNADEHPVVARVWDRFEPTLQSDLEKMVQERKSASEQPMGAGQANNNVLKHLRTEGELEGALNDIIKQRDFYDEEVWSKKRLNKEAKELIAEEIEELTDERSRRLNRLLMASGFREIQRGGGNALNIWYGPWQWEGWSFPISFKEFANMTLRTVTFLFDYVLSIGLFIAILVTANFIPETFLPGSLNLLMSKPISRWGLLLAKFVGGCAFVSLCAVYLFLGVWLWLGIQMKIWDSSILWAIPLYVVVFAIYYSVSTFVGVYSRSVILSIIVTIIFWAACFIVGLTYQSFEGRISNSRTRGLVAVKDKVLHIGELSALANWNESSRQWSNVLEPKMTEEVRVAMAFAMFVPGAGDDRDLASVGPVYDPPNDVILSGVVNLGNPQATMASRDLFVANAEKLKFEEVGKMPRSAVEAVSATDGAMVFSQDGRFWRYVGGPAGKADADSKDKDESGLQKLAGSLLPGSKKSSKKTEYFKEIGPDNRVSFSRATSITFNPVNQCVYIFHDDELVKFALVDGEYKQEKKVDFERSRGAIVESAGKYVAIALTTGKIQLFDAESLDALQEFMPQNQSPFTTAAVSGDGKYFSFLCRNKTLWILNTERLSSTKSADTIGKANIAGQGDVTSIEFDSENRLWYSTRFHRTRLVNLDSAQTIKSYNPPTNWFDKAFEYVINPMYWVFPKPGEFYKLVAHLTSKPDQNDVDSEVDLRNVSDAKNPWQPLWSGLLFMCGMLFLTGLIFHYRDF